MNGSRRRLLAHTARGGSAAMLAGSGLLAPAVLFAAERNRAAFQAQRADEALRLIGATTIRPTRDLAVEVPEVADNGGAVPVEITSRIGGTRSIYVLIDENPFPLAGHFEFREGAFPYVKVNFKMQESSNLRVIAEAGGRYYGVARTVRVTVGGCGG